MKKSFTRKRKSMASNKRKADGRRSTRKGKSDSDAMSARTKSTLTAAEQERADYISKRMSEERNNTRCGNMAVNQVAKLTRVFTAQLEALQRLRGQTTEQRVTVEHVNVHQGGQAIVGAVQRDKSDGEGQRS